MTNATSKTTYQRLAGKVAIVTGASSGIGRTTAKLFAQHGAKVVVAARRESELAALVAEIVADGGEAIAFAGDVQSEAFNQSLVALAVKSFGKLDIAFNNAGTLGEIGATDQVSLQGWSETLSINLTSAFLGAKYQIPEMAKQGGGSIIFTSTFVGYSAAFPEFAAYAASKAGLIGLTQALATEYGAKGVRVNAVLPGAVDTDMFREKNNTAEAQAFITGMHALKRVGKPEEIAQSVLYLASDDASFVSGTASLVDGGLSISRA